MSVEAAGGKSVVYPNPSLGVFTLRFGSKYHSAVCVVVKDVSGKVVELFSSVAGSPVSFVSKLMKGIYFVEVMRVEERGGEGVMSFDDYQNSYQIVYKCFGE